MCNNNERQRIFKYKAKTFSSCTITKWNRSGDKRTTLMNAQERKEWEGYGRKKGTKRDQKGIWEMMIPPLCGGKGRMLSTAW
jgi:hypothetical protein